MTIVLIGKDLVLEGPFFQLKIEDIHSLEVGILMVKRNPTLGHFESRVNEIVGQ